MDLSSHIVKPPSLKTEWAVSNRVKLAANIIDNSIIKSKLKSKEIYPENKIYRRSKIEEKRLIFSPKSKVEGSRQIRIGKKIEEKKKNLEKIEEARKKSRFEKEKVRRRIEESISSSDDKDRDGKGARKNIRKKEESILSYKIKKNNLLIRNKFPSPLPGSHR